MALKKKKKTAKDVKLISDFKTRVHLYCLVLLEAPVSQSEDLNAVAAASQERWFPGW